MAKKNPIVYHLVSNYVTTKNKQLITGKIQTDKLGMKNKENHRKYFEALCLNMRLIKNDKLFRKL